MIQDRVLTQTLKPALQNATSLLAAETGSNAPQYLPNVAVELIEQPHALRGKKGEQSEGALLQRIIGEQQACDSFSCVLTTPVRNPSARPAFARSALNW